MPLGLVVIAFLGLFLPGPDVDKPPRQLQTTNGEIICIGFDRSGGLFYAGSLDSAAYIWETKNWKRVLHIPRGVPRAATIGEHQGEYRMASTCAISPDGKTFAMAGDTVDIYAVPSGKRLRRIPLPASAIAFPPDGDVLATARRREVSLLQASDWRKSRTWTIGAPRKEDRFNPPQIHRLVFSPRGDKLLSATPAGEIAMCRSGSDTRLLDFHEPAGRDRTRRDHALEDIGFSPDGEFVAAASGGREGRRRYGVEE